MSFGRVLAVSLSTALCVALLATMIPGAAIGAAQEPRLEYIVTIKVKDSGRKIRPTNRANRVAIRQRAKAADAATKAITKRNNVKAKHEYGNVITGFSARMTKAEARKLAKDPKVTSIRVARKLRTAGQLVPVGIKRVKAFPRGAQRDVEANVAVIDTGIGPVDSDAEQIGVPIPMTTDELEIAGGWNCAGAPPKLPENASKQEQAKYDARLQAYRGRWGDVNGHGTHVAGIIGARDNPYGTVGVAPGVSLFAVRAMDSSGSASEAAVICGLEWVAKTRREPAMPSIDVVNMSFAGPRDYPQMETCSDVWEAEAKPEASFDPIHLAVCNLKDWGVPMVAAAGNRATEANDVRPGGYNQVITVGAMTDTDGTGWAKGPAPCSEGGSAKDDTYAKYSNYGPDVDIVAPGTCIWSTWYRDPSGDKRARATGTSAAAPHVVGAIARYVDQNGRLTSAADVDQLRQRIRAAGSMNWDARTDPSWAGVSDNGPPNRVLDVTALTGSPAVKTFVYHQNLTLNSTHTSRATRVDVQRSGGYEGPVSFSADVKPSWIGSISFDEPSIGGLGRNDLGTNVNFTPKAGTEDARYTVAIKSNSGAGNHARNLDLTIDRTLPEVGNVGPKVRGKRAAVTRKGATQVYLQWIASDAFSGLKSAQLQRKTGTSGWKNAGVGGTSSARVWLKPGQNNKFRVRVTDNVGNVKNSNVIRGRLSIRDSENGAINRIGAWKTKNTKKAYGGSLLFAGAGAATLKTKFHGKAVAILAPIGRGRGKFRVRVDGGPWKTVNTKAGSGAQRRVVWTARLTDDNHKVVIQRVSGRPAIDGIIFVR